MIDQHKEDLKISREKLRGHDAAAKKAIGQLQQEMIVRVNQVSLQIALVSLRVDDILFKL